MNEELKQAYIKWRDLSTEIEKDFNKGSLSYHEYLMALVSAQRDAASEMFTIVHSNFS